MTHVPEPQGQRRPLRCLHVGLGGWGAAWCRTTLPDLVSTETIDVVGVVDIDPARHLVAQEHLSLPAERCFIDVRHAIEQAEPDFVTVVVTPSHHEEVIDAAVQHHLPILCEKPIADTMAGCCRVYRKVAEAGLPMAVTMSHRFDQDKLSLEQQLRSGEYGRLSYLVHRFTMNNRHFGDWGEFRHRIANPLLVEGTVHHVDIWRALADADVATIYARTWNPPWGEYAGDSTGMIIAQMTNGVRCLYEGAKANASGLNGWTEDYLRAECEHATLELDRRALHAMHGPKGERPTVRDLPLRADRTSWLNTMIAEQFCDWLRGGTPPATTLDDNIQCCAALFAAIKSARTGRVIDVQEFLHRNLAAEDADELYGQRRQAG